MLDILAAIYHNESPSLCLCTCIEESDSPEERRLRTQLRVVKEEVAEALIPSIEALADKQAEKAFYSGVRFGAQLMAQLLKDF